MLAYIAVSHMWISYSCSNILYWLQVVRGRQIGTVVRLAISESIVHFMSYGNRIKHASYTI